LTTRVRARPSYSYSVVRASAVPEACVVAFTKPSARYVKDYACPFSVLSGVVSDVIRLAAS
jgi:hypothetical protein